jgi:formamidopyrimidine-DNA glycosylase
VPELPEVEITRRGLAPHLIGQIITGVVIRQPQLRWTIPADLPALLTGHTLRRLTRRAKYLLASFDHGTLILHLGMSGSLRILHAATPPEKHDHFDLLLSSGQLMRLRDPRRFGAVLWHAGDLAIHPLLAKLGPEPLEAGFDGDTLYRASRNRNTAIKLLIMDNQVVVGVGNIYANEALFRAGIRPTLPAGKLSKARCTTLAQTIRETLAESITQGGSTLRDFVDASGQPGYFQQSYWVYGRAGEPCRRCGGDVLQIKQGQRSSFYCAACQR